MVCPTDVSRDWAEGVIPKQVAMHSRSKPMTMRPQVTVDRDVTRAQLYNSLPGPHSKFLCLFNELVNKVTTACHFSLCFICIALHICTSTNMSASNSNSNYRVVEPHPTVPNASRRAVYTGRGGSGNVVNLKDTKITTPTTATGPASLTRLDSRTPSTFTSGRGGAGNVHRSSERAIFSFDEELERDMRRAAPVYHVGRGGAGNTMYRDDSSSASLSRKYSATSTATNSSTDSVSSRARDMARRGLEKGWGKLKGTA